MVEKANSTFSQGDGAKHSEREVELWTELQSTRVLLNSAKTEIQQLKDENTKIMETVHQAAQEDDICKKYDAEIEAKHEQIQELNQQIQLLSKAIASSQVQNTLLETKLRELEAVVNKGGNESSTGEVEQIPQLKQKITKLEKELSEILEEKKQVIESLTEKQLEIEQREKVIRGQTRVLKVRDELIVLLNGKEQRHDEEISSLYSTLEERDKSIEMLSKEIRSKTHAVQELCSTLERKQIQVNRLEKRIKEYEQEHKREQSQRTRYEARIEEMERVLKETKYQGWHKMLFG
ncbi:hypothetical protein L9F63_019604 [Diploptera punctata]|uniref:Uncharacterized protein n=1 Tax=Diploptera punctata TaxID=6984 RepID=A0AAD7ZUA8_DIPPU|nr:hypothetical protein L9F63_019604 [Diploptera punctata]